MSPQLPRRTILATAGVSAGLGGSALAYNEYGSGAASANEDTASANESGGTNESTSQNESESESEAESENGTDSPNVTRLVNVAPDIPAVDLYANGTKVLSDIPVTAQSEYKWYKENTTFDLIVTPPGAGQDRAYLTTDVSLTTGPHTLVLVGEDCQAGQPLRINPIADDYSTPPDGTTRFTFTHAVPDVGPLGVWAGDGDAIINGLPFGTSTDVELPADTGNIAVYDLSTSTRLGRFPIDLEPEGFYSAYAIGYADTANAPASVSDDFTFSLAVTSETPPDPEMYGNGNG